MIERHIIVMYSLQHGVNLSRRACRLSLSFICLSVFVSLHIGATPLHQPSADSAGTYRPIAPPDVVFPQPVITTVGSEGSDKHETYPGMQFGPMGPLEKGGLAASELVKQEPLQQQAPSTDVQEADVHLIERYKIMSFDFGRVETPFLIGLWIFCASLAKIGRCTLRC